jgi:hypothetical protein
VSIGLLLLWLILSTLVAHPLEVVIFAFGIGHLYDYMHMLVLMLTNFLFLPQSLEDYNLAIRHHFTCYLTRAYNLTCC